MPLSKAPESERSTATIAPYSTNATTGIGDIRSRPQIDPDDGITRVGHFPKATRAGSAQHCNQYA